jgi:hypothetical protein
MEVITVGPVSAEDMGVSDARLNTRNNTSANPDFHPLGDTAHQGWLERHDMLAQGTAVWALAMAVAWVGALFAFAGAGVYSRATKRHKRRKSLAGFRDMRQPAAVDTET